jgi:hypothetical protein
MNQESRKEGKGGTVAAATPQRVVADPSHRLWDKPIHLPVFLIDLYV